MFGEGDEKMRCDQAGRREGRQKRYSLTAIILLVCLVVTAVWFPAVQTDAATAAGTSTSVTKKVSVKLTVPETPYKTSVRLGNKIKLTVLLGPAKLKVSKCKFKSLNKKIATVTKKGVIKPKKKGTAAITVKYKNRMTTITVKVKKAKKTTAAASSAASSSSASKTSASTAKTTSSSSTKTTTTTATASGAASTLKGAPGRRTIKGFLQNAFVPCGRTLYIYGGGWGVYGEKIGYLKTWKDFYEAKAGPNYDYSYYQFQREKGLDCSGFVHWTLYNTLYSKSGVSENYSFSSYEVADRYAALGWCTLSKNAADTVFKPGDVVTKKGGGHVWISLGQCSDGSVVILHSTNSSGVQLSGTKGRAAELARYYMKKYFPKWPYTAMQMGSGYWEYQRLARWKTSGSGSILSDPDGIQKMSAEQVLRLLLGK